MARAELELFASEVLLRFRNPFIHHRLEAIALNSWPKFAARVIPQLIQYQQQNGRLPPHLICALAATMILYRGNTITLSDEASTLAWFARTWSEVDSGKLAMSELVEQWLANLALWGRNLNEVPGLSNAVTQALISIEISGITEYLSSLNLTL